MRTSPTSTTSGRCLFIYKLRPIVYIILHLNIYFYHIGGSTHIDVNDFVGMQSKQQNPYFDEMNTTNVTAVEEETAVLKCRVKNKGNRTVSWMRKRDLHILTTNIYTYTGDQRFAVVHPPGSDDWDLKVEYAQQRDTGIYECQVNTEPKINLAVVLEVTAEIDFKDKFSEPQYYDSKAARAKILGSTEIHVKRDSTIALACSVNIHAPSVIWYQGSSIVDFDSLRGGISLETEKTDTGTTSRLMLTRASLRDSGNYTCMPTGAIPASVRVHVLTGEQPAAMQTSKGLHIARTKLAIVTICLLTLTAWQRFTFISHMTSVQFINSRFWQLQEEQFNGWLISRKQCSHQQNKWHRADRRKS
ncbi:zwei Ig domain protein zig-8 isoform X2 [Glossina fuscipes]|uniref:Zwei Ig domain protein zig-8 isoform X2 n=1 Tax=Glossina fuscipes TaxID=7396 RepID=A0A9C5ZEZ5_9MUSC|nr:zwei Ig domain protein zig-8 isoform X2 [Glossina fuscipes]